MTPSYTTIRHVDSNRSYHTQEAIAARKKRLNHFTYQCIRDFPREVELKRQERARKKINRITE